MTHSDVVIITGASAGIGRAIAREFGRRRARVGLLARGIDGLEAARREIESAGGQALVLPTDVSDADAIEHAAERVEAAFGPIDIWINNAMASVFAPVRALTPAEVRRVTEVTYLGYAYGTMTALRRMVPRDRGTIVQVGSALAYRGIPLQAAYCAAKHAIQGFTDSVHCELLHDGSAVKITEVNLPAVNTPQFDWVRSKLPRRAQPVPPIYQPELIAEAIVWAAYHYRRSWNIGWPAAKAVVGNNFVPGYADSYLARHGYDSQQTDEPEDPERPSNLWEPLPGDRGARGRFTDRAKRRSTQILLNRFREPLLLAAATFAGSAMIGSALATRLASRKRPRAEGPVS